MALIYYKSGKNYLADSSSTIEQLAVGYFCEHKSVHGILDAIRNKLKLDESYNWRRTVKKLFKKKDKTLIGEKEKKKKDSFTETDATEATVTPKGKTKKSKQKSEPNDATEKAKKPQKKSNESEVKAADSEESDDSSENDVDVDVKPAENNDVSEPPTTVDDFFITADGSNYLSTAVSNRNQEGDSDGETNQRLYRGKDFDRKPKEASFFHKSDKKPVKLAVNRSVDLGLNSKRKWLDESEEQVHQSKEKKVDPELHPSWQAKQKLKPTITEFKGKKITFD